MGRYLILDGNTVVNIAEAEADFAASQGWFQDDEAGIGWIRDGEIFVPPVVVRDAAAVADAINTRLAGIIATGCPIEHGGDTLHIQMDDRSIAKLTAMAATATGAMAGSIAWPASYATGWITAENTRIPLATAGDGYALAAMVGDYSAALSQHARDLKDLVEAAEDQTDLDGIEIDTGWPEAPGVPATLASVPVLIAQAMLVIDDIDVSGFGTESGIALAIALEPGVLYVEFIAPVTLPYLVWTSNGGTHRTHCAPEERAEEGFLIRTEDLAGNPEFPPQLQILVTKA
jgi:hypothetical protein